MYKHLKVVVLFMIIITASLFADDRNTILKTGKTELVYGIGADNLIYITKVDVNSGYREVLISLDGKYSVNDLRPAIGKAGATFVLTADLYENYNEPAEVGKPIVVKEQGPLVKIKVFVVTDPTAKNITGERRFITTKELAALPCSRPGYHYGISTKDELLFISNTSNHVIKIHPKDNTKEDPAPAPNNTKKDTLTHIKKEMVLVHAKAIQVLSETDNKMTTIKFDKPFYMDKYEVTNSEYNEFIKATGRAMPASWKGKYPEEKSNYPVLVDWAGAQAYAEWAGKKLPSYDQWRAAVTDPKNQTTLWTTEPLMIYYNKYGILKIGAGTDTYQQGMPVGKCESDKSPFGVYGLLGNVQEWTSTKANQQDLPEGKTAIKLAGYVAQSTNAFGGVFVNGNSIAFANDDCYGFRCVSRSGNVPRLISASDIKQGRFIVNDTTINDTETGLVWSKNGFSVNDILRSVYPEAKPGENHTLNNGVIKKFLEKIKADDKIDWRLPTEKDTESLKALVEAHNPGRLVFYLTKGDDDTKINAIVLKAHEYITHKDSKYILVPVSGGNTKSESRPASVSSSSINAISTSLPEYKEELTGSNEVRIKNPNGFSVSAGIRTAEKGKNLNIRANGTASVYIPNGKYEIFFVYSNKPEALFQGDDFTLNNNGIEIRIVQVIDGNYNIRQVK